MYDIVNHLSNQWSSNTGRHQTPAVAAAETIVQNTGTQYRRRRQRE